MEMGRLLVLLQLVKGLTVGGTRSFKYFFGGRISYYFGKNKNINENRWEFSEIADLLSTDRYPALLNLF